MRFATDPKAATSAQVYALLETERIIRARRIVVYCVANITGTLQLKVGYQGGTGAEIVANVTVTATTAGTTQVLTIVAAVVPPGTVVIVTPTAGAGGTYQVLSAWDSDY